MEDFLTKQSKLELVYGECQQLKDTNGKIKWDDCVSVIKKMLPNLSETKLTKLLSDGDIQGCGQIETDILHKIIDSLLSEETSQDECGIGDELPDEEQEQERKYDLLEELYKIVKKGEKINLKLFEQLAKKHNVEIGK